MKILEILNESTSSIEGKTRYAKLLLRKAPPKYALMELIAQSVNNTATIMQIIQMLNQNLSGINSKMVRFALKELVNDGRIARIDAKVETYKRTGR